jgi:putative DNA primase/helicase
MKNLTRRITSIAQRFESAVRRLMPWLPAAAPGPTRTPALNKILLNLCGGDRELALYVLRWIALPLRRPRTKMATALWLRGGQGNGKSLFFERLIAPLFREHAALASRDQLTSHLNHWMINKHFVVVTDDARIGQSAAKLKQLLTSQALMVHQQGRSPLRMRNHMNFVVLSGQADALAIDPYDRRFVAIDTGPTLPAAVYFAAIEEIESGGIDAYHKYLTKQIRMDGFSPFAPPPVKDNSQ